MSQISTLAIRSFWRHKSTLFASTAFNSRISSSHVNTRKLSSSESHTHDTPADFLHRSHFKTLGLVKSVSPAASRLYSTDVKANEPGKGDIKISTNHGHDGADKTSSKDSSHKLTDVILSNYEKRKLVLVGMYKSMADVPDRVSEAKMHRAGDLFRIYTNVAGGVVLFLAFAFLIIRGQRYRKKTLAEEGQMVRERVSGARAS